MATTPSNPSATSTTPTTIASPAGQTYVDTLAKAQAAPGYQPDVTGVVSSANAQTPEQLAAGNTTGTGAGSTDPSLTSSGVTATTTPQAGYDAVMKTYLDSLTKANNLTLQDEQQQNDALNRPGEDTSFASTDANRIKSTNAFGIDAATNLANTNLAAANSFKDRLPAAPQPFSLSAGQTEYDASGNPIATQPAAPFNLSPGDVRYDATGKVIATGGAKPDSYQVVKGSTDAFGNPLPDSVFDSTTGKFVSGGSGGGASSSSASSLPSTPQSLGTSQTGTGSGSNGLSFQQYGLLANTDFNPKTLVDGLAQKYLDQYIKNGTVPTASSLGRNMKPEAMAQVDTRARDLYFQATGKPLPTPQIIKAQQAILANNYKLGNNLGLQEQTVTANVDLSLANMTKAGLNSSGFKPLDDLIDDIKDTLQDPNVGQFLAQNSTIANEVSSLLAVKNASGTTVYDKLTYAGIIGKDDSPAMVQRKLQTLIKEASNFSTALQSADSTAYQFTDPLEQDANNPARNSGIVNNLLSKQGIDYNDLIAQMQQKVPAGTQPAINVTTGVPAYATPKDIASGTYIPL